MKDIKIILTAKRQFTELMIFCACFIVAFILNIVSIVIYDTEWTELITQLLWVLCLSVVFYFLALFCRLLWWSIRSICGKKQK